MRRATQIVAAALALGGMYGCGSGQSAAQPLPGQTTTTPSQPDLQPTPPASAVSTAPPPSYSATTRIPSTLGRIAAIQIFDYAGYGAPSWIARDAGKYDAVWGSVYPHAWTSAHPGMLVADYFILGLDRKQITKHNVEWYQSHHPDWVMYSCSSDGSPTHDVAYMKSVDDEVPLDIHNPEVVKDQLEAIG
ncbi:MAG: hypothetical protein JO165_08005, partial [Candidatus Eremiobacteraeota bacterium]|nr:hypothetical protein [Candidatus Eremiobacteraeota bacterium]